MIYKICPAEDWAQAQHQRSYTGSPLDRQDGFIHFSTGAQVAGTLARYYADANGLVLVAVDNTVLGDALKFEPSRDGALFPHLYGALPLDAVRAVYPLARGADGVFVLPPECH